MESLLLTLDVVAIVLLAYSVFRYESRPQRKQDLGLFAFKLAKTDRTDAKKRKRHLH
ncbi:MAG: hypothetical protein PGN26_06315 [Xylophilus ampelinus]